ncbi:MAG: 50S ribosomal protein L7/L12 [Firmicutes bacterium]|nr:50S ribosomal protein L7/L12 [Bacillota bacterium]
MADLNKILEEVKGMTVLELNDLVKLLEEEFGVSAAAMAVAAGPAAGGEAAAAEEEKTDFNIHLTEVGSNKIGVIKVVREVTGLGLGEAKALVDGAPSLVKEGVPKASAEEAKKKFEEIGAKVELK